MLLLGNLELDENQNRTDYYNIAKIAMLLLSNLELDENQNCTDLSEDRLIVLTMISTEYSMIEDQICCR
jgi:hypothetical protein